VEGAFSSLEMVGWLASSTLGHRPAYESLSNGSSCKESVSLCYSYPQAFLGHPTIAISLDT
jgi:hypothetical protein